VISMRYFTQTASIGNLSSNRLEINPITPDISVNIIVAWILECFVRPFWLNFRTR
jgi:hypothetical protein